MEQRTLNLQVMMHKADSRWFLARDYETDMTVVGTSEIVPEDMPILAEGEEVTHPQYGRQFKVYRFIFENDDSAMAVLLGSGILYGVGQKRAEALVKKFGAKTFNILDFAVAGVEDAIDQLCEIKGITRSNVQILLADWVGVSGWARNALYGFKAGLSPSQVKRALIEFTNLQLTITHDPYSLTKVRGITFETADKIAQLEWPDKKPIPRDSPQRQAAAVRHVLEQAFQDGHTCLPSGEVLIEAERLIHVEINPKMAWEDEGMVLFQDNLFLKWVARMEEGLVASLVKLNSDRSNTLRKVNPNQYTALDLSPDQIDAIAQSVSAPITVITGGPGTGKTTCINTILNILDTHNLDYTLCAPTGKAAKRMEEATDRDASTIHRALNWVPGMDPKNDIRTKFLIVDEASMIDTEMMSILLENTYRSNVILVGDVNQLPPVGPGEPFMQIIESGIFPVARLNVIHRQGKNSGIVHAAHNINSGKDLEPNKTYDDFRWFQVHSNDNLPMELFRYLDGIMDKYHLKLDDLQILTPTNKNSYGQRALNQAIQERYNPGPLVQKSIPFKVEDRVIHTKNNYALGVMNGEVGKVIWVADKAYEDRGIDQSEKEGWNFQKNENAEGPPILTVDYGDKVVQYAREDLSDLQLAYAITIHKSQGSEFPAVVMLVPHMWPGFELRQLIYTGITRAKEYCLVITPFGAIEKYIRNETRLHRNTMVAARLQLNK